MAQLSLFRYMVMSFISNLNSLEDIRERFCNISGLLNALDVIIFTHDHPVKRTKMSKKETNRFPVC